MAPRRASFALLGAIAVAAGASASRDAGASVSVPYAFDALVHESTAAAVVTPIAQNALWEDGRIVTYTEAHVDTAVAGAPGAEVWVRTLGGEVGHIGQSVEGEAELTVGRPCLVFLRPAAELHAATPSADPVWMTGVWAVTGRAQGQFPVVQGADGELHVVRSSRVGATMSPKGVPLPVLAADVLHGQKVTDATDRVTRAWGELHAP